MADVVYKEFPFMRVSSLMHRIENRYNHSEGHYKRQGEVSKMIVGDIARLCRQNGIIPVVAGIWQQDDFESSDLYDFCRQHDIPAVDISFEWKKEMTNLPHDVHPGPLGHKKYAENLVSFLRATLIY